MKIDKLSFKITPTIWEEQYESSTIARSIYNADKEELIIEFKNKVKYVYSGVDLRTYENFKNAKSQGVTFHKMKSDYDYVKVEA